MNKRLGPWTALAIGVGILLASVAPTAAQGGCQVVHRPYATLTDDDGRSFVPYRGMPITDYSLTWGLAATDLPGLVYMHAANALWVSEDDGCNWKQFGSTAFHLFRITAASGAVAYAWPENGGNLIYRLEPSDKGNVGYAAFAFVAPESEILGLGVDASDPLHLRALGGSGQIYESFTGGGGWTAIGEPANPDGLFVYFAAFDPNDLDHVLVGQPIDGGFVTFDGGQSWDRSLFLPDGLPGSSEPPGQASDRVNLFIAVISPVDPNIVYGRALDQEEADAGDPSQGRHLYRSLNGGLSFAPVIDDFADGVPLPNQPLMVADRDEADVVHLVQSASPFFGGTTFYRYDGGTDTVQSTSNQTIPIVRAITFSRQTPGRFLVGFEIVR